MAAKTKVTLDYPITVDGKEIKFLELRRATVNDLEAIDSEPTDFAGSKIALSRLAEITPEDVGLLDAKDYEKASEVVLGFLE